jgi:hypothetical protein
MLSVVRPHRLNTTPSFALRIFLHQVPSSTSRRANSIWYNGSRYTRGIYWWVIEYQYIVSNGDWLVPEQQADSGDDIDDGQEEELEAVKAIQAKEEDKVKAVKAIQAKEEDKVKAAATEL